MSYLKDLRKIVGNMPLLSAGATVIVMKDERLLLNLRSDTLAWGIPGGAMELGETFEETASREL
jgi:8-oxo-dGTP pyrophosphatase MutT (NUDIX family)